MTGNLALITSPRRREVLRLVWDRERSAGEIAAAMPEVTFGAVSQHLAILEREAPSRTPPGWPANASDVRAEGGSGELRRWLGDSWSDALARLKMKAELEASRRGQEEER